MRSPTASSSGAGRCSSRSGSTIVYFPVAHWVFSFDGFVGADAVGGWIANVSKLGALDFAGGTAVHINAGAAGLALAIVLGKRRGWPREPMRPHNLPFVLLGAALLWFGWFGFNAGSALGAGDAGRRGLHQHHGRDRGRGAGLAGRRADPRRQADHAGRRLRRGRRPGRHHPGLWVRHPARRDRDRRDRRCGVRAGRGAEVPVRLRRLARRGRRAPGRRSDRHPADRVLRHHQRQLAGRRRPVLRRRRDPAGQAGHRRVRGDGLLVRGHADPGFAHQVHDRLPGHRRGRGRGHRRERARGVRVRLLDSVGGIGGLGTPRPSRGHRRRPRSTSRPPQARRAEE